MKKILIIFLTLCLILSFTVPSYAAYSTESYLIFFKTKTSYENTEYEELFSEHKNFLDPAALGIPGLAYIRVFGAAYSKNFAKNQPFYVMCAQIGFSTLREASAFCAGLMRSGIADWAVFINYNDFSFTDVRFNPALQFLQGFVKYEENTIGDIDCSNSVTAEDARAALRIAVGLENKADYPYLMGDMDFDGEITSADAREILRVSVGLSGYLTLD